jgi:hypothetical protein
MGEFTNGMSISHQFIMVWPYWDHSDFFLAFSSSSIGTWFPPNERINSKLFTKPHGLWLYSVLQNCQNPNHFDDFDVFLGQNLAKWLIWQPYSLPLLHVRCAEKWLPSLRSDTA